MEWVIKAMSLIFDAYIKFNYLSFEEICFKLYLVSLHTKLLIKVQSQFDISLYFFGYLSQAGTFMITSNTIINALFKMTFRLTIIGGITATAIIFV